MKNRTIKELHDSEIGHRKFAKVCDLLMAKGHKITDIKEFNEKFTFVLNEHTPCSYDKCWKGTAKSYVDLVEKVIAFSKVVGLYGTK